MIFASIDSKVFEDKLRIFSSGLGGIYKELLSDVGQKMVDEARSRAPRKTGKLANAINFRFDDKNNDGILTTRKANKSGAFYALFVEKGTHITPKKSDYLTFKINGEWKKVKSAGQRPQPFFYPTADGYFGKESDRGFKELAEVLQRKMNEELT